MSLVLHSSRFVLERTDSPLEVNFRPYLIFENKILGKNVSGMTISRREILDGFVLC